MVTNLNPKKRAIYWSDPNTFYQRYREGDILMYWGNSSNKENITEFFTRYPN
jgi:hypothetical protein